MNTIYYVRVRYWDNDEGAMCAASGFYLGTNYYDIVNQLRTLYGETAIEDLVISRREGSGATNSYDFGDLSELIAEMAPIDAELAEIFPIDPTGETK